MYCICTLYMPVVYVSVCVRCLCKMLKTSSEFQNYIVFPYSVEMEGNMKFGRGISHFIRISL